MLKKRLPLIVIISVLVVAGVAVNYVLKKKTAEYEKEMQMISNSIPRSN